MATTTVRRTIKAPVEVVFDAVAHIDNFVKVVPEIVGAELLSETRRGVGTRFRETRRMRGKDHSTDLEVTEYVPNEHVRIVTDTHGTVWDTVFRVRGAGDATELTMTMEARAYRLMSKLVNPLAKGAIKRAIAKDMDAVKTYCERQP